MSVRAVGSIKIAVLKKMIMAWFVQYLKNNEEKELSERLRGLEELVSWIFNKIPMGCRNPIFRNAKIKRKCSGKIIKRISRRIHEAGGCDAKDDYGRGYDDAITLALNILLEETGYNIEDIID